MKLRLLSFLAAVCMTSVSYAQTQFYQNSFETTIGWSLSHVFDDGFSDYSKRDTLGGFSFSNTATNVDGMYLIGAEDTDAETTSPSDGVVTLSLDSIFIDGFSSIDLTLGIANPGGSNYDQCTLSNGDSILIEAQVDTNGYQRLAFFCTPAGSNHPRMYLDTNGNKIGGDVAGEDSLDANLRDWTFPISGSGKYLNIRIKYRMDSGNEEVAFDNVRLSGSGSTCGNPQNLSISNITSSTADASWVSNATLAQIQWEASGFTLGNGFKDTSSTGTFSLPSLNSGTTYDVYVKDSCASSSSSWLGPISFTTVSSVCNDPDSLEVSNVSFTQVDLGWRTGGSTSWNIEWDTAGFLPGTGNMVMATNSNPYTLTGLTPGTNYQFWVQDTCNGVGVSSWVGPFPFVTSSVPSYPIMQIHSEDTNGVADSLGTYCWTSGIVAGINMRTSGQEFFMVDPSNNAGIMVFDFSFAGYTVLEGDSIRVRGSVAQFNGLTQFTPDSIEVLSSGVALPNYNQVVGFSESLESQLLELVDVELINPSQWPATVLTGSGANVDIRTLSGDTVTIRIDRETNIDGNVPTPSGLFTVRGILGQFDFSSPYDAGYQLFPRYKEDILVSYPTLFINELSSVQDSLIADPADGDFDDWIEILNPNSDTVDLANYYLSDGSNSYRLPAGGSETMIAPGGHLLIWADDSVQNGNNHLDFTLAASGSVHLIRPDSSMGDSITYPSLGNNESYGRQPDGSFTWVVYDGSDGEPTPGDTNALATPPVIPAYSIGQINKDDVNGEPDSIGVYCSISGTVFTPDLDGNAGLSFFIHDGTGGINVFNFNDVDAYVVTMGDSIQVYGEVDFYRGLTELFVDSIKILATAQPVRTPTVVTSLSAATEAELITLEDVQIIGGTWPGPGASDQNLDLLTQSGDTVTMRIETSFPIEDSILNAPSGLFTVTGVGGQFDFGSPYTEGYQIFPRFDVDIDSSVCAVADGLNSSNVTDSAATLSWNGNGASTWDLRWGTGGTPMDSISGLTDSSYTLMGLTDTTAYDYWVKADCGSKSADWSDVANFTTLKTEVPDTNISVNDLTGRSNLLKAYPNPIERGSVLQLNMKVNYTLYNVVGQAVRFGEGIRIETIGLESGVYLLQANTGETIRVVVK